MASSKSFVISLALVAFGAVSWAVPLNDSDQVDVSFQADENDVAALFSIADVKEGQVVMCNVDGENSASWNCGAEERDLVDSDDTDDEALEDLQQVKIRCVIACRYIGNGRVLCIRRCWRV